MGMVVVWGVQHEGHGMEHGHCMEHGHSTDTAWAWRAPWRWTRHGGMAWHGHSVDAAWAWRAWWAWTWTRHGHTTGMASRGAAGAQRGLRHSHGHSVCMGSTNTARPRGHRQLPRVAQRGARRGRGGGGDTNGCPALMGAGMQAGAPAPLGAPVRMAPQHPQAPGAARCPHNNGCPHNSSGRRADAALCQQGCVHPGALLLHHHGVLRPGSALRGAACRAQGHPFAPGGLVHGHRRRHELPAPPQDHPPRPQVAQVSGDGGSAGSPACGVGAAGGGTAVAGAQSWWW